MANEGGSDPREALLCLWLKEDRGRGPILFPPDLSKRSIDTSLFPLYRRLWLSYESGIEVLGSLLKSGWSKTPRPWRMILSLAYAELMWAEEAAHDHGIVHSWVELAKKHSTKGAVGVINGSLRNLCRKIESGELSRRSESLLPDALLSVLSHRDLSFGLFLSHLDGPRRTMWFADSREVDSEGAVLDHGGVWLDLGVDPQLQMKDRGGFVQNDSAAQACLEAYRSITSSASGPVLDYCAAPGGKTRQLKRLGLERLKFFDGNPKRLKKMVRDFGEWGESHLASVEDLDLGEFAAVLLDVPCSNSGVLSKAPEAIRHYWKPGDEFLEIQEELLLKGLSLLREDGLLLYSTCSMDPVENEERVKSFVRKFELSLRWERHWLPDGEGRHGAYMACLCQL